MTFNLDGQVDPHNLILKAMTKESDSNKPFDNLGWKSDLQYSVFITVT